jgi:hypothetical protein
MNKCPRCNLPQKGTHRCQYCGYVFSKSTKSINAIRNKLKDIIGAFNNKQMFAIKKAKMTDQRGTRSGSDRRKYLSTHYSPERRSGKDRRKRVDRSGQVARKRL